MPQKLIFTITIHYSSVAIPKLTKTEKTGRKKSIVSFLKRNPLSSADSMFRNGVVEKSKASQKLLSELVKDGKISLIHSEKGKSRYYINSRGFDRKHPFLLLHCEEITYQLNQISEKDISDIISLGKKLVKRRIQIFEFEIKRKISPKIFLLDKDVAVILSFLQKQGYDVRIPFWNKSLSVRDFDITPTREKTFQYLDTNFKYADIFVKHHFDTYRNFDNVYKNNKKIRSIQDKLEAKTHDDNIELKLSRIGFLDLKKSITDKLGRTDYKKIIDYKNAEDQSSIYNNNEFAVYAHMKEMIQRDVALLRNMSRNFPTHDYQKEIVGLSYWWYMIEFISMIRMENILSGNDDSQINIKKSDNKGIIYDMINNKVSLSDDEKKKKEFLMSLTLSSELK